MLESNIPSGPIEEKWERSRFEMKLVNPANRRKHTVIIVGSGLAGASAAASLGQQGYNVHCFCFHDSPRRAHSIAAQGGINAAKNYRNDGDSIHRLFYDTVKGGDFRSREANVYPPGANQRQHHRPVRGAGRSLRARIRRIARHALVRRRAGFAHVLRARADGAAVAARRVPGARGADRRRQREDAYAQRDAGPGRRQRQGARHRHARSGDRRDRKLRGRRGGSGDGRLRQRFLSFDQREGLQHHGDLARASARRVFRQSLLHADSSDVHSGEQRKSVQADAHVRIAAQRRARVGSEEKGRHAARDADSRGRARLLSRAALPELRQSGSARRRFAQRPRKFATKGAASGPAARACTWISRMRFAAWANRWSAKNTAISSTCTKRSPAKTRTKFRCGFIPRSITRWAACGWIIS